MNRWKAAALLLLVAVTPCGRPPRAVLRADSRVPHGDVIRVVDVLKQAGIVKIAFAVAPEAPSASPAVAAP
ncbi:MAG: biopolymer transporter ExbD [Polyangiaceae bacterium]|nr:biopolymer transporter ExbD [Polyangiaceae bacterium]